MNPRGSKAAAPAAYAGIELGGTKILCRGVGEDGTVLGERRLPTLSPAQSLADLARTLHEILGGRRLRALGVASFGPIVVDPLRADYGRFLASPKPGWSHFDLRGALMERFDAPFVLETDVNAAALAEQQSGAARGLRCVAYVTVGTGIGGGLALEGRTLKGALHPEVGHMRLRRRAGDDHPSTCPFHEDCAEGLASGPAVTRRLPPGRTLSEDSAAFALVAGYLGDLAANLVLAWSPERIVFGGGLLAVPGLLAAIHQALRAALNGYGAGIVDEPAYVAPARFANAGLEGAMKLAREAAAGPMP